MVNENLYIKGKLETRCQPPVLPEHDIYVNTNHVGVTESSSKEDGGGTFKGFAATVNCSEDVTAALRQVMRFPIVATTSLLIFAYRIDNGSARITNLHLDGNHRTGGGNC